MTARHLRGVVRGLLACGTVVVTAATVQAQAQAYPEGGGMITIVGCVSTQRIGSEDTFVLAKPTVGHVASVSDASCTASEADQVVKLQDEHERGFGTEMLGRWVEVTGRMEKNRPHKAGGIRELHIKAFAAVPVEAPKAAAVMPATEPIPEPVAQPAPFVAAPVAEVVVEERPVATAGVRTELPKTATSLPLVGLIGFVSLAGGVLLRLLDRRSADVG